MARSHWKRQRVVVLEITIQELSVRAAHSRRRDFDQDLICSHVRHFDIFEYERLLVTIHSRGAHLYFSFRETLENAGQVRDRLRARLSIGSPQKE